MKKILICVPMKPIQARYVDFFRNVEKIIAPEGYTLHKEYIPGWFPHYNRNEGVKIARALECSHIFFLDDDVIPAPDILIRLVARNVPVVSANMLYRCPPFNAYAYRQKDEEGRTELLELPSGSCERSDGLTRIETVGAGALLIKTEVFESLEYPWWEINQVIMTDDILLCKKLKDANIPVFYDFKACVGHISEAVVWPAYENGEWVTKICIMNSIIWTIPKATIVEKEGKFEWNIGNLELEKVNKNE